MQRYLKKIRIRWNTKHFFVCFLFYDWFFTKISIRRFAGAAVKMDCVTRLKGYYDKNELSVHALIVFAI
jgi:hypothetical protein